MALTHEDVSTDSYIELREQISNLQGLLMLSLLMTQSGDEDKIIHLSITSVPSFYRCPFVGIHLSDRGWQNPLAPQDACMERTDLEPQIEALGPSGGMLTLTGYRWCVALPLRGLDANIGYFVVAAETEPSTGEQFLVRVLAQQTGVALANARLHRRERASTEALRHSNVALAESVMALEYAAKIHARFTEVATKGQGEEGIANALHELTGLPVAIEDRFGNLRAWAGPDCPSPYPKEPPANREAMLQRCVQAGEPIRQAGRLSAVARPRVDIVGVLSLIDPQTAAGDQAKVALEHGTTVLAMELARLRSLAEAELRLRRDLVEELLLGTDDDSALARAEALGHDLGRCHRVLIVEPERRTADMEKFFHGVRRAARNVQLGSLIVARASTVVILSDAEVNRSRFVSEIGTVIGDEVCRVGVGGWCDRPQDFPRSYREAQLALKMQKRSGTGASAAITFYDELGVYRILAEVENQESIESFVRQWLGPLLDYDVTKRSQLVPTLAAYLQCGGHYDRTTAALYIHRSTLKYRLSRIRDLLGIDINDPDARFNLELATRAWGTLEELAAGDDHTSCPAEVESSV
ncbi:MAG: helix-turn-helix domain-containing protein [Mycobacterium sp.]